MTSEPYPQRRARRFVAVLQGLDVDIPVGTRILDIGCGAGGIVQSLRQLGFDAYGCDLAFKDDPEVQTAALEQAGHLRLIDGQTYALPFEDDTFDVVISDQVIEHVENMTDFVGEISRVCRTGGATFHVFPARRRLIEPHVMVPMATRWQSSGWLRLWASLGIRAPGQQGLPAAEVAQRNLEYLHQYTHYRRTDALASSFDTAFETVETCEGNYLAYLPAAQRAARWGLMNRVSLWVYREFVSTALLGRGAY